MSLTLLAAAAQGFGVPLDTVPFEDYLHCILAENDAYGLTSLRQESDVEIQLLADALAFFGAPRTPGPAVDLGSGAGIPGIPLALADAALEVTLVEARQRKGQFLARMVERLKLRNRVRVISERVEVLGRNPEFRETFPLALAKGLAPLNVLLELGLPLLKVGGLLIAWKGPAIDSEIEDAQQALAVLHARIEEVIPYTLPQDEARRRLVLIRKDAATPATYPRRAGQPKKAPLR